MTNSGGSTDVPGKLAGRSTSGCWTCRLRKKKCDENHPSCHRCISLQIICDGYGPRPYWMDRGDLQREQARYKTRQITQIRSATRLDRTRGIPRGEEPGPNALEMRNDDIPTLSTSAQPHPVRGSLLHAEPASEGALQHYLTRNANLPNVGNRRSLWSDPVDSTNISIESFYDPTVDMTATHDQSSSSSDAFQRALSSGISSITHGSSNGRPGSLGSQRPDSQAGEVNVDTSMDLSYDPMISESASSSEWSGYSSEADWSIPPAPPNSTSSHLAIEPAASQVSVPIGLSKPILQGDMDDILFMYYFDHVFYIYCPFYFPLNRQGRGWLFSILKRVRSAYYAALVLSKQHYLTCPVRGNSREGGRHYDSALQELQVSLALSDAWSGNLGLAHNIEVLTTILHLLFYESSNGGKANWQIHLGGANNLLPPLVHAQLSSFSSRPSFETNPHTTGENLRPDTSISFLLGFFIQMNIISCASTRSSNEPLIPDHKLLLESREINLSNLTGCSNWAMVLIFDMCSLDRWKKKEQDAHRLSLLEFTKRGRNIEERLLSKLAELEEDNFSGLSTTAAAAAAAAGVTQEQYSAKVQITRIFALSALIYLHVVISGPYPQIPDIASTVAKTLNALQNLSDPKLMRHVVWPYCISGCMADDSQHDAFRALVPVLPGTRHGTCVEALEIMEECWRLRKKESLSLDWAQVMKKRGQYILLI